jgi:hypothetical protein
MNNTQKKNTQSFAQPFKKGKRNPATREANASSRPVWYTSSMKEEDIVVGLPLDTLITKQHEGKWVAISADHTKLVDVSDDLLELERRVAGQNVTVLKVMRSDVGYAPLSQAPRGL